MPTQIVYSVIGSAMNVAGAARTPPYGEITAAMQSVNAASLHDMIATLGNYATDVPLATLPPEAWGGWVATSPRVTRSNSPLGPVITTVVNVWQFPDGTTPQQRAAMNYAIQTNLRNVFNGSVSADEHNEATNAAHYLVPAALAAVPWVALAVFVATADGSDTSQNTSRWAVRSLNYDPAVNGPLSGWANGDMTQTRTREEPPSVAGFDRPDNPYGPTDPNMTPTTVFTAVADAMRGATLAGLNPNATLREATSAIKWIGISALMLGAAYVAYRVYSQRAATRALPART